MSLAQIIQQHVDLLPQYQQAEVLDFVLFLEQKKYDAANNLKLSLRKPHPIAAQVKIIGDILGAIPIDDYGCVVADGLVPNETFDLFKLDALCQK